MRVPPVWTARTVLIIGHTVMEAGFSVFLLPQSCQMFYNKILPLVALKQLAPRCA